LVNTPTAGNSDGQSRSDGFALDDLDWSRVAEVTVEIPACPATWAGFARAFEIHRQIMVQRMPLPEKGDWNFPVWVALLQALLALGRRVQPVVVSQADLANLVACIEQLEFELRMALDPPSEEELNRVRTVFGESPPSPEEGDEWRSAC
jgi:hypothetical protein